MASPANAAAEGAPHEPHVVRIHLQQEKPTPSNGAVELIKVQPAKNGAQFTGVHIEKASPTATSGLGGQLPPVQMTYRNIKFGVNVQKPKTKTQKASVEHRSILKGCDGTFNPGRLTFVMGASGAGKTSLLNIVSGNPTAGVASGEVCLNGTNVFDSMSRIRELSAFIQQDDVLMGSATVREAVTLSARLRLPKSMPDSEKLARVDEVIAMLGLTKCVDTVIGDAFNKGVSGGEKRRVSMALELIKSPAILFLDEPTSGLDTYTAHSIIALLRDIAHTQNKTIVCTIHQPSSEVFHMADDLCLLADGQVMYHGKAAEVVQYFDARGMICPDNYNPSDHLFMKVLYNMDAQLKMISDDMADNSGHGNANEGSALVEADKESAYDAMQADEKLRVANLLKEWLASSEHAALQKAIDAPLRSDLPDPSAMRSERPGEFYAFQLLSSRRWYDLLRDRMKIRMQFGQYIFFSLLLGLIYLQMSHSQESVQNRQGCLFFVCVQAMFMSFMSNLNTFGPEKIVMTREMESGMYGLPSYFFSRWIIELPFRMVFPFIYSVILYFLVGFQSTGEKFILFAVALILIDNCGTNMAVMICSLFPEIQQAMQAGPALVLPMMVFSGFYVKISSVGWWFRWISYISPVRYGFCAVIKNEMDNQVFHCGDSTTCYSTGAQVIEALGLDSDPSVGLNLGILVILLGGYLMGAFYFMWRTTKKR